MRYLLRLLAVIFWASNAYPIEQRLHVGSREGDPASLVENVSTIHGDYSEKEVDLTTSGSDPLVLSRYYSSRDHLEHTSLGGWRFNPHCFLSIQRDPHPKTYTTAEGKFDYTHVIVGTSEGAILSYVGWQNTSNPNARSLFKLDVEGDCLGITNTAHSFISAWTNLKSNSLYFNSQTNQFELFLKQGGKRVYVPSSCTPSLYLLQTEILPSGNKIFYEYEKDSLILIKMTNAQEKKVLSWIQIQYGPSVHIQTSDGKTVEYRFQFQQNIALLSEVIRSNNPSIKYQYCITDNQALITRKDLPEGRFVEIEYYKDGENKGKVARVATPSGISEVAVTRFGYTTESDGKGITQVDRPLDRRVVYHYDDRFQLTTIEEYLKEAPYRISRKIWGKKRDATNLIATSIEDGNGGVYYYKRFLYDDQGNITEECEYGNLTGAKPITFTLNEESAPEPTQESHTKTHSYLALKNIDIVSQKDCKGNAVQHHYKKNTNQLVGKFILENGKIKKRWFYSYNEDGALCKVIVDDGDNEDPESTYEVHERYITVITPKKELPNIGAPEIIEEKYLDPEKEREILLKKIIHTFDAQGNIVSAAVYDANESHRYTLIKAYTDGLLSFETDPIGNEIRYSYDRNQNLISVARSYPHPSFEYRYDLKNRLIYVEEKDNQGNRFETHTVYDVAGNKTSETDRFGNQTIYTFDELGRVLTATYPAVPTKNQTSIRPIYTYNYDLLDHITSITDPKGEKTQKTYTVHGNPTLISYPDGSRELFKYDTEGSLHRHLGKDGIIRIFEYDYQGRLVHIEYYERGSTGKEEGFKREYYEYDAFHLVCHRDEEENSTQYFYDGAGRLASVTKGNQKTDFIYDDLGRTQGVKKWKSEKAFTLETKEYDLLGRVVEERTEDTYGRILLKNRSVYDKPDHNYAFIGYPQNEESVLARYKTDGFGRIGAIEDAFGATTYIQHEDGYVDEWGQRVLKRIQQDSTGICTEELFDLANRLTKRTQNDPSGQCLSESTFFFDMLGNSSVEDTSVLSQGKLLRTYRIENSYEKQKLKTRTLAAGTAEEKTTVWEYDVYGNPFKIVKPGTKEPLIYRYDNEGNLSSISYKEQNRNVTHKIYHDRKGNITKTELGNSHTISTEFNANNLPELEVVKDQFGSYQVEYSYDGEGCIKTIQLPDGSLIKYTYQGPFVSLASRQSKEKRELYHYRVVSRDQMGHILEEVLIGHAGARKQAWDKGARKTGIFTDFFSDQIPEGGYDSLSRLTHREFTLDSEKRSKEYDYNPLSEIILEKGEREISYSYDSLGNRLQRGSLPYQVNEFNQTLKIQEDTFTFDATGHLATKTKGDKVWKFQANPLGHLISIEAPSQKILTFAYDLNGKRLLKKVEEKGKKPKIYRYFYLGETELGCIDEKGNIVELKVPSDPNNPEASPPIAIEIKNEVYAPFYDLQGNIACLIDPEDRKVVESYSYSAFGEEEIISERGAILLDSALGNPWRYRAKRVDSETGLVYFGQRYYDPKIGKWISPDPVEDGPNLYRFCQNNPLKFVDYFGLVAEKNKDAFDHYFYGEYEPHCHCERHRECKRGGDIGKSADGMDFFSGPRFQGSMQAFSGLMEVGFGGGMTLSLGGIAAPLGWPVMAHGLDQFFNGMTTALTGRYSETATSQILQTAGLSPHAASLIDSAFSLAGSMGGAATIRASQLTAHFHLPVNHGLVLNEGLAQTTQEITKFWPSAAQGRRVINGIEYSTHALERMSPRGLIQNGTEIVSRGVPPSVVENAIKFGTKMPGNTSNEIIHAFQNIKVVTTSDERLVITVITTGR